MPAGFTRNGTDLDNLFKARSTTKRADVSLQTATVDVSNRFEKTAGGDLIAANTGFASAGTDLKQMFQDILFGGTLYATSNNYTPAGGNIGAGPFTTVVITITAGGGTGGYSYAWARQSGDATITISSATSTAPTWSASGTAGTNKSAVWRCTVTDSGAHTTTVDVTVTITFYNTLTVGLDKSSVSGSGTGNGPFTTDTVTATPGGGSGGYTYAWQYVSGSTIPAGSASSAATSFSNSATAPATLSGVYRLLLTDSLGNTVYSSNVSVALSFNSATLSVSVDKSSVSGARDGTGSGTATSDTVTASPTGGTPGYFYLWEMQSGDGSTTCNSSTSAATSFSRVGSGPNLYTSVWRCRVTDSLGVVAYGANLTVQLNFTVPLAVSLDISSVSGTRSGGGFITTNTVTATASGGAGGYSYAWLLVSGTLPGSPTNPSAAATAFSGGGGPTNTYTAYYRCRVTDGSGTIAYSSNVTVTFTFNS